MLARWPPHKLFSLRISLRHLSAQFQPFQDVALHLSAPHLTFRAWLASVGEFLEPRESVAARNLTMYRTERHHLKQKKLPKYHEVKERKGDEILEGWRRSVKALAKCISAPSPSPDTSNEIIITRPPPGGSSPSSSPPFHCNYSRRGFATTSSSVGLARLCGSIVVRIVDVVVAGVE